MKNAKGITLVALIITIILMLILVAVTIDISTEGGLIPKSRQATSDATWEAEEEQILSEIYSNPSLYNSSKGKANLEEIKKHFETDWTVKLNEDKTKLAITKGDGSPHIIKDDGTSITNRENAKEEYNTIESNKPKESYYNINFKEDLSSINWDEIAENKDTYIIFTNDDNPNIIYEFYIWFNNGHYSIEYFPNLVLGNMNLDYADGYKYELYETANLYKWIFVDRDEVGKTWDRTETITTAPTIQNVRIMTAEEIKTKFGATLNLVKESDMDKILTKTEI